MEICKVCGRLLELYKLTDKVCYVCIKEEINA